jgi:AcrR family transcriptional regulator
VAERLIRGRTLAERRQERRDALLASALELFGTKGYAATSVEHICRHANVSTRNFYEEFDNRVAVLSALDEQIAEQALQALISADVEPGPDLVVRRARARVAALVHAFVDDPHVARVMFVESVGGWAQHPALMNDILGRFPRWLHATWREHLDALGVPPVRQKALAIGVVGAATALLIDWVRGPADRASVDDVIDSILETTIALLRIPTDPSRH